MTVATKTKTIEDKAHELAVLSVQRPCIDMDQLVRFATIDQQIATYGVKDLTGLSDEELLKDLLGE
jgi:hypothetical protein